MRPWQIWLAFVGLSGGRGRGRRVAEPRAIDADDAQAAALRQAALEENARLALWRMDSAVAPLVAQESARPYFAYEPFYSVERAYGLDFGGKKPSDVAASLAAAGGIAAAGASAVSDRRRRSLQLAASSRRDAAPASGSQLLDG